MKKIVLTLMLGLSVMTGTAQMNSKEYLEEDDKAASAPSLNEIRFRDWGPEEWLDNEYIKEVRKYLDNYTAGKFENEMLAPYKKGLKSPFIIGNIEPYMLGGAFIQIIFLDMPDKIFSSWVYSDVDTENEKVTDYSMRSIRLTDEVTGLTREDILAATLEHPELRLW